MTPEEMKAQGQADGRLVIEEAREGKDRDVDSYLARMLRYRDYYQSLLQQGVGGENGAHDLALTVAYANGVLSCFD